MPQIPEAFFTVKYPELTLFTIHRMSSFVGFTMSSKEHGSAK
jgi:hypothetical protein